MTTNREKARRGTPQRAHESSTEQQLHRRRAEMHAAEGHAGSIPRGNQEAEQDHVGNRRQDWDRLLGH